MYTRTLALDIRTTLLKKANSTHAMIVMIQYPTSKLQEGEEVFQ